MAAYFSPQGSSREEAILNVIKALQLFDNYQEKIFSAVEERYGECKTQIQGLNSRLDMLDQKIEFLRQNTSVPISLTLPRRYCEDLKHELSSELKILKDCATPILTEFADAPSVNPKYLREAYARKQNLVRMFDGERQSIPITNQYCMTSNTAAIPVGLKTPFSFQDENKMVKSPTNEQKCPNLIDESMIFEDVFQEPDITDTLSYRPGQIPVTEFDLPEFLPNLPVFGLPSTSKSTPKSPVDSRKDRKDDNFIEKNDQKLAETSKLDFLTEQSSSFPKIPEIQVDGNKEIVKMVTIPQTISQQPPPPPPPPPPPMLPPLPKSSSTVSKGADGGRSSLMEAIRATGGLKGANLKKLDDIKSDSAENAPTKGTESTSGGRIDQTEDLMTSLAKALEKRRQFLSGDHQSSSSSTKKKASSSAGSKKSHPSSSFSNPMSSLRERIPPPVALDRGRENYADSGESDADSDGWMS